MIPLPDEDDLVAAEYALGTLNAEEREAAAARLGEDAAFADAVAAWSQRLAPLGEAVPDIAPPAGVWPAIVERLGFEAAVRPGPPMVEHVAMLRRRVRTWRLATAGMSALAACLAGLAAIALLRQPTPATPTLVAFLQKTADAPAYLVKASLGGRSLSVRPIAARVPAGRSYELWLIDPSLPAPRSLGTLDAPDAAARPLPNGVSAEVAARATYAVTEEPSGGSPTGAPTSTPIYVGHLVSDVF